MFSGPQEGHCRGRCRVRRHEQGQQWIERVRMSVILLWIGLAFSVVAITARGIRLRRWGKTVSGVVLNNSRHTDQFGIPLYRALVGYTLRDGRERETWIDTGSLLSVGTSVQIMYDPDDISNVDLR